MPTKHGPGLRRRYLAQQLKDLRETAGIEQEHVAGAIRCARTRVTGFESGRSIPSFTELPVILNLYKALDRLEELENVRDAANERGWWAIYGLPVAIKNYIGLESDASVIRCFTLELVPGVLQTEAYARDTFHQHHNVGVQLEHGVAARMERGRRISSGKNLMVVASEALLHRTLGMGQCGHEQIMVLIDAARRTGVDIRIIPFAGGAHRSRSGMFTVLEFPEDLASPVAYQEGTFCADTTDDADVVAQLMETFGELYEMSVDLVDVPVVQEFL
jgi:transcriptional regulator with XRE-family HTH domain